MGRYLLRKEDVVESFVRSSGPGGQNVNKVSTCVELWHRPTGIRIKCQKHRRQFDNREEAWFLLEQAIEKKFDEELKALKARREKIKRQNRLRTKSAKEKILESKRKISIKKENRKKHSYEE